MRSGQVLEETLIPNGWGQFLLQVGSTVMRGYLDGGYLWNGATDGPHMSPRDSPAPIFITEQEQQQPDAATCFSDLWFVKGGYAPIPELAEPFRREVSSPSLVALGLS